MGRPRPLPDVRGDSTALHRGRMADAEKVRRGKPSNLERRPSEALAAADKRSWELRLGIL